MAMSEVRVPDIGDFTDVPVIEIHVSVGDMVAVEDPLVTLESDKATMDVPAPEAGVIQQLQVKIGDRVSEGSVLMTLESNGAGASESAPEAPAASAPPAPASTEAPAAAPVAAAAPASAAADGAAAVVDEPAPPPPAPDRADDHDAQVVVIGSGPGGYAAAFRAADLGLKTILIERFDSLGGVCLNVGCIPSKALLHAARVIAETEEMSEHGITFAAPKIDVDALISWKAGVVDRLTGGLKGLAKQRKVEVIHGSAQLEGPNTVTVGDRTVSFDNCIIAAGSEAAWLPDLPDDPRIVSSTGALSPTEIPKRLLVVGGGIIGLEMATVYDGLGSKVTVVELMDHLIPGCDRDLIRVLQKRISARYEAILLETMVVSVKAQKNGLKVEFSSGASQIFDQVLIAVGRRPNGHAVGAAEAGVTVNQAGFIPVDSQMRTNVPWIYAIGDICGEPMLAHKATHEGHVAAEVIAGQNSEFDPRAIPSVAYTDPEVAWMGLTETQAKADGIKFEKSVFPWAASGRALALGRGDGHTKLLVEPETNRLLGAGIVGVGAGELIAETVHAIEMGADAEDIALTIHPHPTLSETVGFSAEVAIGSITDLIAPARRRR
jgi:dihydrolipoamide dehydrogenase